MFEESKDIHTSDSECPSFIYLLFQLIAYSYEVFEESEDIHRSLALMSEESRAHLKK